MSLAAKEDPDATDRTGTMATKPDKPLVPSKASGWTIHDLVEIERRMRKTYDRVIAIKRLCGD